MANNHLPCEHKKIREYARTQHEEPGRVTTLIHFFCPECKKYYCRDDWAKMKKKARQK